MKREVRPDFEEMTRNLIKELEECNIEELETIRLDWKENLKSCAMPPKVIEYCDLLVKLVIKKKQEKARATV